MPSPLLGAVAALLLYALTFPTYRQQEMLWLRLYGSGFSGDAVLIWAGEPLVRIPILLLWAVIGVAQFLILRIFLRRIPGGPRFSVALCFLFLSLIPAGTDSRFFLYAFINQLGMLLAIPAIMQLSDRTGGVGRVCGRWIFESPRKHYLAAVTVGLTAFCAFLSQAVFQGVPHVPDSIAQVFQAKALLTGKLFFTSHPLPRFFDCLHLINDGRWFSMYPPGAMLGMAVGHLFSSPWVVNPIFAGFMAGTVYALAREIYEEKTARLAALLACASPFVWFQSAEFLSHPSTLLFSTLHLLFAVRALKKATTRDWLLAGVCAGLVLLSRPLSGIGIVLPAFTALAFLRKPVGQRVRAAAWLALPLAAATLGLLAYNASTTGSPLLFGHEALYPGSHFGFGPTPQRKLLEGAARLGHFVPQEFWLTADAPHTLATGTLNLIRTLAALNKYVFEWPALSLAFVFALFLSDKRRMEEKLLLGALASLTGAYVFYYFMRWILGPRFAYEALGAIFVLSAAGIFQAAELLAKAAKIPLAQSKRAVALLLVVLFTAGWARNLPALWNEYASDYYGTNGRLLRQWKSLGVKNALVFAPASLYCSLFSENPPDASAPAIFARDLGESENRKLREMYPSRKTYFLRGNAFRADGAGGEL